MRKLKEVLRLHSIGMSQHQIARSCSISQSTVHVYICGGGVGRGAVAGA
jgi:DNA-binding NarL/FixJ family response regulator